MGGRQHDESEHSWPYGDGDTPEWLDPVERQTAGLSGTPGMPAAQPLPAMAPAPQHRADPPGRQDRRTLARVRAGVIGPAAGAAVLAMIVGVGAYALAASGGDCSGKDAIKLDVAAAPEIEPALTSPISRFNDADHQVGGACVQATARKADPAAITTLLSGQGVVGGANRRPDAWIPDSSLWTSLVGTSPKGPKGKDAAQPIKTSLAQSPLVAGVPRALALKAQTATQPSWNDLFKAASGSPDGAIPPGSVRLRFPDPARTASGMSALMVTDRLLAGAPDRPTAFTSLIRAARESISPSVTAQFTSFRPGRNGRSPLVLAPEQAIFEHNRTDPADPAVALYPHEGTLSMDYPFAVTADGGDRQRAARLLERELAATVAGEVRRLGFRSADGKAPPTFGPQTGVNPQQPRKLPAPAPADVQRVMQAWAKLSLTVRLLVLFDISGSMAERVAPDANRLQATARGAQNGLPLLSEDSELGIWLFSTALQGTQDWRELVPIGPLGERLGSATRRQLILSGLSGLRVKPNGDTGLYQSALAAFRVMKRGYKPDMVNSVLLFTDGRNDDDQGPTLEQTVATLKAEYDPARPVQILLVGYGPDVNLRELNQIAGVTRGAVMVASTPEESRQMVLTVLSRRVCAPAC